MMDETNEEDDMRQIEYKKAKHEQTENEKFCREMKMVSVFVCNSNLLLPTLLYTHTLSNHIYSVDGEKNFNVGFSSSQSNTINLYIISKMANMMNVTNGCFICHNY